MEKGFLNGRGVKEKETNGQSRSKLANLNVAEVVESNKVQASSASSYANLNDASLKTITSEPSRKSVNFRTLLALTDNGADVAISMESICVVHERLSNSVYGFFLGKRVSYPVVENCVKNTLSKYGLVKSMTTKFLATFYQPVSKKNGASSNGIKKQAGLARQATRVSSAYGTLSEAFGSPNTTPIATRINDLERQMLDEKLVLANDDRKPLEKEVYYDLSKDHVHPPHGSLPETSQLTPIYISEDTPSTHL
ncbi:hypothetical protein Tco_1359418 [Tanacetum coccineum]